MVSELQLLTVFLSVTALLSAAALVPFILFSGFIVERYERLFTAFIVGLLSMLSLDLAYIANALHYPLLYKALEFVSLGFFIVAAVVIVKNTAAAYVLLEKEKELDAEVKRKTSELRKNVKELEDSRTAVMHILRDLEASKKEVEIHAEELENLHEVMIELTSELSLDTLLENVAESARRITGARYAAIGVTAKSEKGYDMFIPLGFTKKELSKLEGVHLPTGKGMLGALFQRKTPVRLEDLTKDKSSVGFPPGHPVMRSFLGVPIISKDTAFGNIYLTEKTGGFTEEDERIIQALAAGAAVAIENAKLYTDLEKAFIELKDVDRLKTDIISNVSHELRTPVTISRTSIELAREEDSKEEQEKLFSMIENAMNRLNDIVEDLVNAADIHAGVTNLSPQKVDLRAAVPEFIKLVQRNAKERKVSIKVAVPETIPTVKADPTALKRVFRNLLDNAVKFSKKEGGEVTVTAKKEGSFVSISISDDGIGIPEDKLQEIFSPLYQIDPKTTRTYGGTGLGLAVAKSLVVAHQGEMWAESEVGVGTTIYFSIPLK